MSTNLTYNSLIALLPSYLERKDDAFKAQIPTFINLAENRIATDMKQEGFQAVVTGTMDLSNVQEKPSFWRENISYSILTTQGKKTLRLRPLEYIQRYWPNAAETGEPVYYAEYNINHFYVAATPDMEYEFELVYYARLEPLTVENQTNWMTLNAPQTLLYAALWEAAMWCKNPAAEQKWMQQYQIATGGIITEDKQRLSDRNAKVK